MKKSFTKWLMATILSFILAVFVAGCDTTKESTTPTEPTTPATPACETNNTAKVTFENRSNTNTTYDIIWDGSKRTTVTSGAKSSTYTEAAGVNHTLVFKITNTNTEACTPSSPTLAQCTSQTFWCTK